MIGKYIIELGADEFLSGVTSSANTMDGGLSSETSHINITAVPGVLHAPGAVTDESTNLTGEVIASCPDPTYLGKDRVLLDDEDAFYWFDTSTTTKKVTASSASFTQGTTDMVAWGSYVYATTSAGANGDITRYDKATTLIEDYWTNAGQLNQAALSAFTSWRPMLVYETNLYIGDANKLHRVDSSLTVSNGILALDAINENITALGIDQGTGRMLVATNSGANYSGAESQATRVHIYDGYSNKAVRVVPVEGLITAFKSIGNTTFVFYGNKLGYWTGSGIEYIRTLNFAKDDASTLVYPHRACGIDNTLYYVDDIGGLDVAGGAAQNKQIMAYGETINGRRAFYPVLYPSESSTSLTALFPVRSHELGYSFATDKLYTFDLDSIGAVVAGGISVKSKKYLFPKDTTIHGAIMEFDGAAPAVAANLITLAFLDGKGNTSAATSFNPNSRSDVYSHEFTYPTIETRTLQLKLTIGGNGANVLGIRRITVFYTPKE